MAKTLRERLAEMSARCFCDEMGGDADLCWPCTIKEALALPDTVQTEPSEIEKPVQDVRELFEKVFPQPAKLFESGHLDERLRYFALKEGFQAGYNAALTAASEAEKTL